MVDCQWYISRYVQYDEICRFYRNLKLLANHPPLAYLIWFDSGQVCLVEHDTAEGRMSHVSLLWLETP